MTQETIDSRALILAIECISAEIVRMTRATQRDDGDLGEEAMDAERDLAALTDLLDRMRRDRPALPDPDTVRDAGEARAERY